jgi:hypothetical protein
MKRSVASGRNRPLAVSFAVSVLFHLFCLLLWHHATWLALPAQANAPSLHVTLAPQTSVLSSSDAVPGFNLLEPPRELDELTSELTGLSAPAAIWSRRETATSSPVAERGYIKAGSSSPDGSLPSAHRPEYLQSSDLSLPPEPVSNIHIDWPSGAASIGTFRGVFTLLIDEQGVVEKAEIDGPTLTPSMEACARKAFLAARFRPGMLDGKSVKSALRVEVEFAYKPHGQVQEEGKPEVPVVVERRQL